MPDKQDDEILRSDEVQSVSSRRWETPAAMQTQVCVNGDSLLVVQWIAGRWRPNHRIHRRRIERLQNLLDRLSNRHAVVAREPGADLTEHIRRCVNERADALTHLAKDDRHGGWCAPAEPGQRMRLFFDGGLDPVCGAGGGWVIQTAWGHAAAPEAELHWTTHAEAAFRTYAITAVASELAAAEQLLQALECLLGTGHITFTDDGLVDHRAHATCSLV